MKTLSTSKTILVMAAFLFTAAIAAAQPRVCVVQGTLKCTKNDIGYLSPCDVVNFKADVVVPAPYSIVGKYEWYINNNLVKVSTNHSDDGVNWTILNDQLDVYCKITYKAQDGSESQPVTTPTLSPDLKEMNFNPIQITSAEPAYGCTDAVSFSLNTFTCTSLCSSWYTVSAYTITWQGPAGWTQTSTGSNSVTYTPDATTGGVVRATVTLPCGYSAVYERTVSRAVLSPTFATAPAVVCSSPATFAINPACGAIDYTYTIVGDAGITFAANGLQTYTASVTSVNVNINLAFATSAPFEVKVKANYTGSVSSADRVTGSFYGVPTVDMVTFSNYQQDPWFCTSHINNQLEYTLSNVTDYATIEYRVRDWPNLNLVYTHPNGFAAGSPIPVVYNPNTPGYYVFEVRAVTACGASGWSGFEVEYVNCSSPRVAAPFNVFASPNPASNDLYLTIDPGKRDDKSPHNPETIQCMLYTFNMGQPVRAWKLSGNLRRQKLNIAGIKPGQYVLVVTRGKDRKTLSIVIKD